MTNLTKLVATSLIAAGLLGTAGMGYYHATAEDQAKPTVKAEPKPKVAEKVDAPKDKLNTAKLDSLDNTGLKDEARVRNALGKRIPIQNVTNFTVEAVFAQLSQEFGIAFRFDLAAFKRLFDPTSEDSGILADMKMGELKMPAHISSYGTLGEFLSDLMTIFPGNCSYRIRGNQIVIGPSYKLFSNNPLVILEQKLGAPVFFSIDNRPISEAVQELKRMTGANIILDARSEREKSNELIVSGTFDDVRLHTVLDLLSDMCGLKLVVVNNVYYITNPANARTMQQKVDKGLFSEPPVPEKK